MLDTHARRFFDPLIDAVARGCLRLGLSANQVTLLSLLLGLAAAGSVALGAALAGIILLWLSGLLDAADGAVARMTRSSAFGAILDVTFDRVVEMALVLALGWRHPEARFALLALACVIVVAMSLFLTIAAAMTEAGGHRPTTDAPRPHSGRGGDHPHSGWWGEGRGQRFPERKPAPRRTAAGPAKSFHYAPGLAERSEGFVFLSLMALDATRLTLWTWLFVAAITFTAAQRLNDARRALRTGNQADSGQGLP